LRRQRRVGSGCGGEDRQRVEGRRPPHRRDRRHAGRPSWRRRCRPVRGRAHRPGHRRPRGRRCSAAAAIACLRERHAAKLQVVRVRLRPQLAVSALELLLRLRVAEGMQQGRRRARGRPGWRRAGIREGDGAQLLGWLSRVVLVVEWRGPTHSSVGRPPRPPRRKLFRTLRRSVAFPPPFAPKVRRGG
jgi:hypothetical protein